MISQFYSTLAGLGNDLLDVIMPPFCARCRLFLSTHAVFCAPCESLIKPIVSVDLEITQQFSIKVLSIGDYHDPLKKLILAKGWSDIIAARQLGLLIWHLTNFKTLPCDYLIPIPLHRTRYAYRGYNQAEEIARTLGAQRGVPVVSALTRKKRTAYQASLAHDQRKDNVKNAFELAKEQYHLFENKHIVLLDDLMTTGVTLRAAAKQLQLSKPASISAVVAARVI